MRDRRERPSQIIQIQQPMSTKKTSIKPAKNIKDELAKGAAAIRAAKAKSNPAKAGKTMSSATSKKPKANKPAKEVAVIVLPKLEPCKDTIEEIMGRRVALNKDGTALKIDEATTTGEAVKIFDNLEKTMQVDGLLLGDAINQFSELPAFKGQLSAFMASTGRSVDRWRTLASVAKNTPPSLRGLHPDIGVEHLRAIVRVEKLEDKKELAKELVAAAESGHPLTVKEVVAKASKINPPKRTGKKNDKPAKAQKAAKETRDLTTDENDALNELEDAAARCAHLVEGAAFLLEAKTDATSTLREKLDRIARFSAQLAE